MSVGVLVAVAAVSVLLDALPAVVSHKLITNPYPVNEWDSVIVSSQPVRITDKKSNDTSKAKKLKPVIRARKRSFEECPENDFKCLYGLDEDEGADVGGHDPHFSLSDSPIDLKLTDPDRLTEDDEGPNSGKSYWNSVDSQNHHHHPHHPYGDKNGWITLDPIPWSSSKISQWRPNVHVHEPVPWSHHSTTQRPVHQFWASPSGYKPQRPNAQWGIGTNDIITDNRPSGFPTESFGSHGGSHHSYNSKFSAPFRKYQPSHESPDNHHPRTPHRSHPSTYPSQGNGEWVLLSTKKGYSQPHKWSGKSDGPKADDRILWSRNIKPIEISRYHEEDLGNGMGIRVFSPSGNKTAEGEKSLVPLATYRPESVKSGDPSKTVTRKVKLQVLPSLESTSFSHGGLLEVSGNSQSMNGALPDEKISKLQTIANVKKNRIRGFKLVPANRLPDKGKGVSQRSALTLAAVGAGMIPATMAILLPMALGRSKRSPSDEPHNRSILNRSNKLFVKKRRY